MVTPADLEPFFQSVLKLKSLKRAGWLSKANIKDGESVADHSFATCATSMVLSDILGLDTARVMKMALLHDLAESVVGDYMPGEVPADEKTQRENKAMGGILERLPAKVQGEYTDIWSEYLAGKSEVARFVHRIDKLEMAMQAAEYAGNGRNELLEPFFESAGRAVGRADDIVGMIFSGLREKQKA